MKPADIEDIYELSPLQQGMLFHTLSAPKAGMYFEQFSFPLSGGVNSPAFEQAWQQVVDQNSILRTAFFWDDLVKPLQVVHRQAKLPIIREDWRPVPSIVRKERLDAYLQKDRELGFDLSTPPLMRLTVIQLDEDSYQIVWSFHHLLLDGWSLELVLKQVFTLYEAGCRGQRVDLAPTRPFGDYIAWLQEQDLSQAENFWRQNLKGFTVPTTLARGGALGPLSDREGAYGEHTVSLSEPITTELQNLARQHRLTLNTIIQGAWAVLLHQHTGESDVVFGSVVSGRPPALSEVESMVGMFLNTLPMRVSFSSRESLITYLQQLQARQFEARQYEYSPLVRVQEWSQVPRGVPLFESVLIVQNYPMDSSTQAQEEPRQDQYFFEKTNYPMTLSAFSGKRLLVRISYDCSLFSRETIELLLRHFKQLLKAITVDIKQPLSKLTLLTERERQQVLVEWNQTASDYPREQTIHELFEAQVARTPDAVALSFGTEQVGYRELNERANRLGHYLRSRGVRAETLVGLMVERSVEMVVGLLGILKAGGAYVPLDAQYPPERLKLMIEDAGLRILLTQARLVKQLDVAVEEIVCLDTDWPVIAQSDQTNPASGAFAESLTAVIFTSGSTGRPKGVMTRHRSFVNRFYWMWNEYPFTADEICCQKTSLSFVDCVWEVFGPLLKGVKLVIIPDAMLKDIPDFVRALGEAAVTRIVLVPSLLQSMMDAELGLANKLPRLKYWITSGETMPVELFQRFSEALQQSILLNLYGSSEVAADATWFDTSKSFADRSLPIGQPIANAQSYVLDGHLAPAPIGIAGELCIGGDGLARGYLYDPQLTAERFIPDPFSTLPGARLYKTGDLSRYRADGNLEFLGRLDYQVKIRGFRIELGEIETVLSEHRSVKQCIVVAHEEPRSEKQLVAYVVCHTAEDSFSELRRFVQAKLPYYMVPAKFVRLDQLPLTPNGKVDRRALPAPDQSRPELDARFVSPRTQSERKIAAVWQDVLKIERVGVHDNFFELGGHSLLIVQLRSRLQAALGVELSMVDLFRHPTVGTLAKSLGLASKEMGPSRTRVEKDAVKEREKKTRDDSKRAASELVAAHAASSTDA